MPLTYGQMLAERRARYPNTHTYWSQGEREQLRDEVAAGWGWQRIAEKHGRTISAVVRRAADDRMQEER